MASLTDRQKARIGTLWEERRLIDPKMQNAGASFVKIMEYVASNEEKE